MIANGLAAAVAVDAFIIEPRWLHVSRFDRAAGVDQPLVVAHLSDLHTSGPGLVERSVVRAVQAAKPDVIVITGDTVDDGNWEVAGHFLSSLRAPLGTWIVDGNWEHWSRARPDTAFFDRVGAHHLVNAAARIRDEVHVLGLDDSLAGVPQPRKALDDVPQGSCILALFHEPEQLDAFAPALAARARPGCAYAFSGHTHGGQVSLPFFGPLWLPQGSGRYLAGWYQRGGVAMYVSRGVGTSILPVRFGARPEVSIVRLVPR
jgi:uncharacterized protein